MFQLSSKCLFSFTKRCVFAAANWNILMGISCWDPFGTGFKRGRFLKMNTIFCRWILLDSQGFRIFRFCPPSVFPYLSMLLGPVNSPLPPNFAMHRGVSCQQRQGLQGLVCQHRRQQGDISKQTPAVEEPIDGWLPWLPRC